jgi:uncharacterized protein YbjQ (UPF0145 family)
MGFFARADDDDGERAESLDRVAAGGIPRSAAERLKALVGADSLFTSGLSVNEFALLDRLGPQPVAQVMGASVVRPGWQYLPALDPGKVFLSGSPWGYSPSGRAVQNRYTEASIAQVRSYKWQTTVVCELDTLTDAWNLARRRALERLREEAMQVSADAVVGVHLRRSDHDLGAGLIEYVVSGTAIRLPGSSGALSPALTDLSVQDYWRLRTSGHEAVGLLASTSVMFASPGRTLRGQRLKATARNQELEELSKAFHLARDTVRARLRGQVSDAHGSGAVGVEFSHSVHREKFALASSLAGAQRGWQRGRLGVPYFVSGHSGVERRGWVITMHAAGTATRRGHGPPDVTVKPMIRLGAGP